VSRPEKHSVAVVIRNAAQPDQVLTVLRPEDDADLPNVWGLPAGTLHPGETWEAAVRRVGLVKLGVQLKVGGEVQRGSTERRNYRLDMRLYEAEIEKGHPFVPQPDREYTQYSKWKWGIAADLEPAAQRGSLCSRLYLKSAGIS
jgi:8-oxo-dGTP diphosphatase